MSIEAPTRPIQNAEPGVPSYESVLHEIDGRIDDPNLPQSELFAAAGLVSGIQTHEGTDGRKQYTDLDGNNLDAGLVESVVDKIVGKVDPNHLGIDLRTAVTAPVTSGIGDIVNVDTRGKGHRQDGKFLSNYELEQISAHQDQIRDGATTRAKELADVEHRKDMLVKMFGEKVFNERYANNPNVNPDAYTGRQSQRLASSQQPETLADDSKEPTTPPHVFSKELVPYEPVTPHSKELVPYEPIVDSREPGMRARLKRMFGKARDLLANAGAYAGMKYENGKARAAEYYTDEERGDRRKILSAVVGAVVLTGSAYLVYKSVAGHGGESHLAGHKPAHTGNTTGTVKAPWTTRPAAPATVELNQGSNPWYVARDVLKSRGNPHPTNLQINDLDRRILKLNHWTRAMARHLAAGTEVKIPK